jgi:hypothetical protein
MDAVDGSIGIHKRRLFDYCRVHGKLHTASIHFLPTLSLRPQIKLTRNTRLLAADRVFAPLVEGSKVQRCINR